jgi:hypothetical protein
MSPALRFTIVAQFLYEQVPDNSVLKNTCSKDIAANEGLRLQMNRKLGLNATESPSLIFFLFFLAYSARGPSRCERANVLGLLEDLHWLQVCSIPVLVPIQVSRRRFNTHALAQESLMVHGISDFDSNPSSIGIDWIFIGIYFCIFICISPAQIECVEETI